MAAYLGGPAKVIKAVTANDSTDVFTDSLFQWVYVEGAGDLEIELSGGQADITIAVAANTYHPIIGKKIKTNTTATGIFAARI